MFSLTVASMIALAAQAVDIEKNNKNLELDLRVIEAFERGPVILEVTLTNRSNKELVFNASRLFDSGLQLPDAWRCEDRYPCAGAGSTLEWTLQPGETWTNRHTLHDRYQSYPHFPAGTYSVTASWRLWTPRQHAEDETRVFAALARTFSVTITPATAENRKALAKRLEAEFADLPNPSPRDGDTQSPFYMLCEKVHFTPHVELIPLALQLLERCPVGEGLRDSSALRRNLVKTLFEIDPDTATREVIDRLITAPSRVEPVAVFEVWRPGNWRLPHALDELLTNTLNPYWWISPPFGEQRDVLNTLFRGLTWEIPRILPNAELRRLAAAKDFWVRAMVYATFADRLTPEWGDAYLKEARERFGPKLTAKQVEQLIRNLGHDEFAVREKAEAELRVHRWEVGPALARAAREDESPEVRKRAQVILDRIKPRAPEGPEGRVLRALSPRRPADRNLLEALAAGVKENPVCETAREALLDPKR